MNLKSSQKGLIETNFCQILIDSGFDFATGVPCAAQKFIIQNFFNNKQIIHLGATKESEALGIAAGAYLAGRKPVVYMQNSGLMNSINDISSLLLPYKIPLLLIVTWRGSKGEDAPQHLVNGRSMTKIFKAIGVQAKVLTKTNLTRVVNEARGIINKGKPAIILISRRTLRG